MIMVMSIVIAFAIVGGIAIYGECQKGNGNKEIIVIGCLPFRKGWYIGIGH